MTMTAAEMMARKIRAHARVIAARPPHRRSELALDILIRARVITLRRQAEAAARAYREVQTVDSDLPDEHRRLRMMLLGRLLPPPPSKEGT